MRIRSLLLVTIATSAMLAGCAQKRTQAVAVSAAPPQSVDPPAVHEKNPRFGDSAVYVDGKPVGVIRAPELPLALKGRSIDVGSGYHTTFFGFLDYARAIGVDVKRLKAMHLYGGSRAVVIDHAELARIGDDITFSFNQETRGKARVHWPHKKLNTNSTIDMVTNVAFYIEKEPPVLKDGELVMPDGKPVEGKVPYAPEEQGNGTRVYVDGALVGTVKRKKLTDDLLASKPEDDRFSLLAYAAKLNPGARQAKAIDLVAGDDVIAHLSPETAEKVTFNVPQHNRGQAVVDVSEQRTRVSAVQIYVNTKAPLRNVVAIADAPEAGLGGGDRAGGGSNEE